MLHTNRQDSSYNVFTRYRLRLPGWRLALQLALVLALLVQTFPVAKRIPTTVAASEPTSDPTGGHLGWPVSPAIDLRTAADAHVTPIGSYKTSIPIEIPGGPGAPSLSLNYDSAMGLGIAGVGWDLSMGWPSLIARDTRFGTPTWDYASPWTWGGAPLVAEDAQTCQKTGVCTYRTAPDSLSIIAINQITATAAATVTLVSGVQLFYEAVHYDGVKYPEAPPGQTDVLAYLLKSVRDPNGYWTCFESQHWGDNKHGRTAVLKEIRYGVGLKECDMPMNLKSIHRIEFDYIDPTEPTHGAYFAPLSYRFGAPVSVNNLMTNIRIYAADGDQSHPESGYRFEYQDALSTETRLPLLKSIHQQIFPSGNKQEHRIRQFTYGKRLETFSPTPTLIDLGLDTDEFPSSLSGSVSRPVRLPYLINNPNGIFQTGNDQIEKHAPAASILNKQWNLMDFNGDGLLDMLVADEQGMPQTPGSEGPWTTYEANDSPGPRPPQQWVYLNEGIARNRLLASKVVLDTSTDSSSTLFTDSYPLKDSDPADDLRGETNWIWQEGRGQTRIGMPQSVTSPEIYQGGSCPAIEPGSDTRMWPFLPDNTRISAGRSFEQTLVEKLSFGSADIDLIRLLWNDHKKSGRSPRATVSAQLSGWSDLDRDGHPDWVVTPAMIEKFDLPFLCREILNPPIPLGPGDIIFPNPEPGAQKPTFGNPTWYIAEGSTSALFSSQNTAQFIMRPITGPSLLTQPVSQPLSFSVDWSEGDGHGFTIPVGNLVGSLGALSQGPRSPYFWMALENLAMQTHAPRSQAGVSFNLDVNTGSATQSFANSAISNHARSGSFGFAGAAKGAILSTMDINLDITLLAGGNVGRSQNHAGLMDWNADGCPDYLLYDRGGSPAGTPATQRAGGLLLFQGNCEGGFLPPVRLNDGFDTQNDQVAEAVRNAAARVGQDVTISPIAALAIPLLPTDSLVFNVIRARTTCEDPSKTPIARCVPLVALGEAAIDQITQVADAAQEFLDNSTDAMPAERRLLDDARTLANWLKVALVGSALDPAFGSARLAGSIVEAQRLSDEISNTVTLLAFQSRINVLSKGKSITAQFQKCLPGILCEPGRSVVVQTEGLADLNGDGLPDYIITQNARKDCSSDENDPSTDYWEVYWGTGTSNLSKNRGFVPERECIKVPQPPRAVKDLFPAELPNGIQGGFQTIPMQVNFTEHNGDGLPGNPTSLTTYSYVALLDYNQDGLLDLVLANQDDEWKPGIQPLNTWRIYLNKGHDFDLARPPLLVSGLSVSNGTLPANVIGAIDAMYPGINSGFSEIPIIGGLRRSGSSVDIGFLDIDTDGTADIAQRVTIKSGNSSPDRAGILYWSRAGSAPQDLLIEELEPLNGARTLVKYEPAPNSQWINSTPDGKLPPGGHRAILGTPAFLVGSVTVEPFAGLATRRTAIGYDYKDPYFDPAERVFRGFGRITATPLDPATGKPVTTAPAVVIYHSQSNGGRGGETLERLVDGNGAPIAETLHGYTETLSISANVTDAVGIGQTYFSARSSALAVEYPSDLRRPAILDLGFDGRWPLANRADRAMLPLDVSAGPHFDPLAATGGAARFAANESERIAFTAPLPGLNLQEFTVEAWVNPSSGAGKRVLLQHPDGYELFLDASGQAGIGISIGGNWTRLTDPSRVLAPNTWSHVAASYDGARLRLFVNGIQAAELAAPGTIGYPATPTGGMRIGCGLNPSNGKDIDCFDGYLGELRIYPDAWRSPPRVAETRMAYRLQPLTAPDFGLPLATWNLGDLATTNDDVYHAITYAQPLQASGVRNRVATQERRIFLGPSLSDLGGYLDYAETAYDGLAVGRVITGNITMQAVYGGDVGVPAQPTPDTVTLTRYLDPHCPGLPTEIEDPEHAVTRTTYDATCTFPMSVTNALGHTTVDTYYGVNGVPYTGKERGVAIAGRYGQLRSSTDPNGAQTWSGYDEWGRPTVTVGPYDADGRPGARVSYQDPVLFSETGVFPIPARVKTETWDDMQHAYITSYAFGDGQTQVEAMKGGNPDWIVSGTQDFDAAGRVIVTYKPRFLSDAIASGGRRCPNAGAWCRAEQTGAIPTIDELTRDPLRDWTGALGKTGAAHVQTAYDHRGQIIRVYGPDVPWCGGNPSAVDISGGGGLSCDNKAISATPVGHFTSYEYPGVGAVRVIDARGVPAMSYGDVHGRLRRTEEYMRGSSQPYAYADYSYDYDGNVIAVRDIAGNVTEAGYDALGRKRWSSDPDMGLWNYTYDKRGQLLTQTDARGAQTRSIYDLLGRVIRTEYLQPAHLAVTKRYTFDGGSDDAQVTEPMQMVGWDKTQSPGTQNVALHAEGVDPLPLPIASMLVDLTRAVEAKLTFDHTWTGSRSLGSCRREPLMTVWLRPDGDSQPIILADNQLLATAASEGGWNSDGIWYANFKLITVTLPLAAMGRRGALTFEYGGSECTYYGAEWWVDDIRLEQNSGPQLEEVVERSYDSAELASAYESAVLDLTFDVPGSPRDRSRYQHAVVNSGAQSIEGVSGRGLDFPIGASSTLTVEVPAVSPLTSSVTVETWVNPRRNLSSAPTAQVLIFKDDEYALVRESDDTLLCQIFVNGDWQTAEGDVPLPPDVWSHAALTYDGNELRCYVNGIQWPGSATSKLAIAGALTLSGGNVNIGSRYATDGFFEGQLDEVRVLDVLRQPSEVLADALSPLRHGPPRGNVLDLTFADPASPQTDTSGANNPATRVLTDTLWPGKAGTSVSFDGDPTQAITIANSASLQSDALTAEVWIKSKDQGDRLLVGKWGGYAEPGWRLALEKNSHRVRFEVNTRVTGPDAWESWTGHTTDTPAAETSWCGSGSPSPTWKRRWVAQATSPVTITTVDGSVLFVTDDTGNPIACDDASATGQQARVSVEANQGAEYYVYVGGVHGSSGSFTVTASYFRKTTSADFVTWESVFDPNDPEKWYHVAGVYDGDRLRVYIDGKPAHRTCTDPETGQERDCEPPPSGCNVEFERTDTGDYALAACTRGSITNTLPIWIGAYDSAVAPGVSGLRGVLDEIRLSNYAKRDFEVAASARPYYAYSHALGQQVAVRNAVAWDMTSFDLLGRAVSTQRVIPPIANDPKCMGSPLADGYCLVRAAFDNLGRSGSLRYPDGEVVVSAFDRGGAQISLTGYGDFAGADGAYGRQPYLSGASLTVTGRLAQLIYGNGVKTSFIYDDGPTKNPAGAPNTDGTFGNELLANQIAVLPPSATMTTTQVLQDQHYVYDSVGNLLNRQDFAAQGPAAPAAPYAATYTYDDLSRLTSFTTHFGATLAGSGAYSYDALGNLTAKESAALHYGGQTECSRSSPPPHAVTAWTRGRFRTDYCYDANGALVTANHTEVRPQFTRQLRRVEYTHNVRGMLASIRDTRFEPAAPPDPPFAVERFHNFYYDAEGTRVHKVEPPLSPGGAPRVTTDLFPFYRVTNAGVEKHYFAAGRRIARRVGPTPRAVFWYHAEHLGSTNLMTDMLGRELTDAYSEYMPFGDRLPTPGNTPDRTIDHSGGFQFTGKELDDTGLYDYGARYYDPVIGRFIEADSIVPDVWPQSLNRYSYVLNNPLNYADPTGHAAQEAVSLSDYLDRQCCSLLTEQDYLEAKIKSINEIANERCGSGGVKCGPPPG